MNEGYKIVLEGENMEISKDDKLVETGFLCSKSGLLILDSKFDTPPSSNLVEIDRNNAHKTMGHLNVSRKLLQHYQMLFSLVNVS